MKRRLFAVLLVASLLSLLILPPSLGTAANGYGRKIVVFGEGVNSGAEAVLLERFGAVIEKPLPIINGYVVYLPSAAVGALAAQKSVIRIEDDVEFVALAKPAPLPPPEVLPWGVDRIDADRAWATSTASGVKVAILDTGIDLTHPDLQANIAGGFNAINSSKSANDDNGHGSHIAGIVAGIDNAIGVVGAGPSASLYAVKVLNRSGSGWTSDIIEGIQWSVNNGIDVMNMSFGSDADSQALHDAIIAAYNAGVVSVVSAGNSGPDDNTVGYPARYPEVIAVSATDVSDGQPYWSSQGPEVDVAAPGKDIFSTYKGGRFATMSGTSMAAPHVTGAVALKLAQDASLTPAQVLDKLKSTAEWLPGLSADEQGSGLVDAEKLLTQP